MSRYRDKYENAKQAAKHWHDSLMEVTNLNEELDKKVNVLETENKKLKKDISEIADKYKDRLNELQRDKILLEGKLLQLEETKKDLQERYNELKQDYREQQAWIRQKEK